MVEHSLDKRKVVSSIPTIPSLQLWQKVKTPIIID